MMSASSVRRRSTPVQRDVGLGDRVRAGGAADEADRHRQLERADEVAVGVLLEARQRGVAPVGATAWECAPASTARVSLPVASTTAVTPFMMPLLWVAAR